MKRLILAGVLVASCSFVFFNWLQASKVDKKEWEGIVLTPEQDKWLSEQFAKEDRLNTLHRKVILLKEKYVRIFNERKTTPHFSAADARLIAQEIENSKKFAQSKHCQEPDESTIDFCKAYEQVQADREWWARLTLVAVELSAATQELVEARIIANEYGENTEAIKRQLSKHTGAV